MKFYELSTLNIVNLGMGTAGSAIKDYVSAPGANGKLLGIWRSAIGRLNQIIVFREFDSRPDLAAERERARRSSDPFGCSDLIVDLDMTSFVPFGRFPPVATGDLGRFYGGRSYQLKPNGLSPVEERWSAVLDAATERSNTIMVMYAMDGSPRIVEICACRSLDERFAADDPWGGAGDVFSQKGSDRWFSPVATSVLLTPFAFSPLN